MSEPRLTARVPPFSDCRRRALDLVVAFLSSQSARSGTEFQFWEYLRTAHRCYLADNSGRPVRDADLSDAEGTSFASSVLGAAASRYLCVRQRVLDEVRWTLPGAEPGPNNNLSQEVIFPGPQRRLAFLKRAAAAKAHTGASSWQSGRALVSGHSAWSSRGERSLR